MHDLLYTKKLFFLIILSCLYCTNIFSAQKNSLENKKYILVINSYTETYDWSTRLMSVAAKFVKDDVNLGLFAEHMNALMVENGSVVNELKKSIFEKYQSYPPSMVLILGNPALQLKDDIRKAWGDIPIVVCAEENYTGPDKFYLEKAPIPPNERVPLTDLAQKYNLVLLHTNIYIKENMDLMFKMIPQMKKFIFVGDLRYVNKTNESEIKNILNKEHPQIEYQFLSPKDIKTTNELIDSLNFIDPKTTGVLFSSWIYKRTFAGNESLATNSHKIIATASAPMFALNLIDIERGNDGIIGGYVYNQQYFNDEFLRILSEVMAGKQPRDIPFFEPKAGAPVLDYEMLMLYKMPLSNCPDNTIFLNKPASFMEQYGYIISGSLLCILILTLFFVSRIRTLNKLEKAKQKEIDIMTDYKNLINNMPIFYIQMEVVKDKDGNPVDFIYKNVNTYYENIIAPKESVVGKKESELYPETLSELLHFSNIAIKENKAVKFPLYIKKQNLFYNVVLRGSHRNNIIDIFCLDNTELHKAQQKLSVTNNKLSMALDVANIVPWRWDLNEKTILCDINKPIELSSENKDIKEELLAVPDSQYFSKIHKEDRERVEAAYRDLIEGRTDKVKEEYRVVGIHDHMYKLEWVEAQAAVETYDDAGKPLTLIGSSLIITNRKRMELELTTAKDRAEESNRLKSAFLANMSHEIRTPLNAIVGFSNILASTDEEEEKQEYVSIIENNNTLLLQLISDILDLSKIEAGTLEYQYSNFELNATMKELDSSLQLKLKSDNVKLEFIPVLDDCPVYMEKNRLSQLIINLVTNAIKFTSEGSIKFGYEIRGKELYFYVSDTGCGIPKENQHLIFERFVKLNSFAQGTGLGLPICKTIVESMGGKIGVESTEGKGSKFWFTLPYVHATNKTAQSSDISPIVVPKDKLTILIAEDNDSNYKLFESILGREYNLIHAWDGGEAVELFKKHDPQIVLMDINMPVMNGYEATKEIRKFSEKVPIIAITAYAYASDEQRVMENGFDAYMPKPINARQLKNQIREIMSNRFILL